jgi:3-oxoacyl-[acyl-carrier-protein] synthase-1
MANKEIVIVSTGMVTSLGTDAGKTAANVRARVSRYGDISFLNEHGKPYIVASIPRDALGELPEAIANRDYFSRRQSLVLRLASLAFGGCQGEFVAQVGKQPLFLALPEHDNMRPIDGMSLLADLSTLNPGVLNLTSSKVVGKGRAAGLQALGEAIRAIQSDSTTFAYAGGADTYIDPMILPTLNLKERCKFDMYPDSFVPGEGAGFLLIAEREAAQKAGLEVIATLGPVAEGNEPGHWGSKEPYLGEGLAATVQALLAAGAPASPFKEVYSTMNSESYWAKEWGVTRIRNADAFAETENMNHPAEFYGDTGAASGLLLVALAAIGQRKGYVESPALVYASSDFGGRAATWVASIKS